jgi:uncharacterized protein (TIRG00374 family)
MSDQLQKDKTPVSSIKKTLSMILLVIVIGVGINILISFFLDAESRLDALRRVKPWHFTVPFLCYILICLIDSVRLILVLSQYHIRISFLQAFYNSVLGYFFSNLTPMATGGQPFQIYHLTQNNCDSHTAVNVMLSHFVEYMAMAIAISIFSIKRVLPIVQSSGLATKILYLGLGISVFFALFFTGLLARPQMVIHLAEFLEHRVLGKKIGNFFKRHNWVEFVKRWVGQLTENIRFLWAERPYIMAVDTLLGFLNLLIQSYSLYYVIDSICKTHVSYIEITTISVILNLIVYYIPTPGASGSIEGIYAMVFAAATGMPALTAVAVMVWRISSYYLHLVFELIVFGLYSHGRLRKNRLHGKVPADNP